MDQANVVSARRVDPLPLRPERTATLVEGRALSYTPALDGIRAFAVGGVLLYHAGVDWMSGGFLGVDAFFVLSGFLITSLLLGEWAKTGGIALRSFWARRARRLLPALFLVLGGVAVYARVYARPSELSSLRLDAFASLGYVANWRFVFSGQGYFDQFAAPSPLRHMWSLAIEEQFYLVWPVLLLGLLHLFRDRARQLALAVVTLAGLSLVVMLWLYEPGHDPSRVYYGTDTRAQSLLIGAFVAVAAGGIPVLGRRVRNWVHGAALVAVCVLGWMWCTANESSTWLYQGGLTVAAVAIATVIVSVTQRRSGPLGAVLSLSPLVWVGTISYGLYLWHWPIYLAMTPAWTGLDGAGLVLARDRGERRVRDRVLLPRRTSGAFRDPAARRRTGTDARPRAGCRRRCDGRRHRRDHRGRPSDLGRGRRGGGVEDRGDARSASPAAVGRGRGCDTDRGGTAPDQGAGRRRLGRVDARGQARRVTRRTPRGVEPSGARMWDRAQRLRAGGR